MPFKVPKKKFIAPLPSCCVFSYGQIHPEPDSWATSLYILSVFQGKTPSTAKPSIFIYSSVLALSSASGSLRLPCASPNSLVGFLVKPICPFSQNSKKRTRSDLKSQPVWNRKSTLSIDILTPRLLGFQKKRLPVCMCTQEQCPGLDRDSVLLATTWLSLNHCHWTSLSAFYLAPIIILKLDILNKPHNTSSTSWNLVPHAQ